MFDDLAVFIQPEDVDSRPILITRPELKAVQDDQISLGNHAPKFNFLARICQRHSLEIVDEGLLAVSHGGVVLNIDVAGIFLNRLARFALVEHQVIKRDDRSFVLLDVAHRTSIDP